MREITLRLERIQVLAHCLLLEDEAPKIAEIVWNALPISGPAFHAKWANNEVYTLVPPLVDEEPDLENGTVFPIPGDLLYFSIPPGHPIPGGNDRHTQIGSVDIALFYGRDNYLLGPSGHFPGSRFAEVRQGLQEIAEACNHLWRSGHVSERLTLERRAE